MEGREEGGGEDEGMVIGGEFGQGMEVVEGARMPAGGMVMEVIKGGRVVVIVRLRRTS